MDNQPPVKQNIQLDLSSVSRFLGLGNGIKLLTSPEMSIDLDISHIYGINDLIIDSQLFTLATGTNPVAVPSGNDNDFVYFGMYINLSAAATLDVLIAKTNSTSNVLLSSHGSSLVHYETRSTVLPLVVPAGYSLILNTGVLTVGDTLTFNSHFIKRPKGLGYTLL